MRISTRFHFEDGWKTLFLRSKAYRTKSVNGYSTWIVRFSKRIVDIRFGERAANELPVWRHHAHPVREFRTVSHTQLCFVSTGYHMRSLGGNRARGPKPGVPGVQSREHSAAMEVFDRTICRRSPKRWQRKFSRPFLLQCQRARHDRFDGRHRQRQVSRLDVQRRFFVHIIKRAGVGHYFQQLERHVSG